jgi:3-hydroxy-5-methyl-1-naphthoate 3-O-methyltransferase
MNGDGSAPVISPVPLMEISTGFWASKTLAVSLELGLFTLLSDGRGLTAAELAEALRISERPAEMLLTGCASLGLLQRREGRYVNTPLADECLVPGRPYYFGGWVQMLDQRLYRAWGELDRAVRTNSPTSWDPGAQAHLFDGIDPELLDVFWDAMHSLSAYSGRTLAHAVDLSGVRWLLDVGGGSGSVDIELCRYHPDLRATVFDLPEVCPIAETKARLAGVADRIGTAPGDFLADAALPAGHDAVLLSMVLHDWDEDRVREILRKCHDALPPDGLIIISELLVNDEKTGPAPAALMSLNMLIETGGRNYTPAEYTAWLSAAGFSDPRVVWFDSPGANGAITARRP